MEKEISLKDLNQIAQDLINKSQKAKSGNAVVIALSGDLGSGKTTLSQQIGKALGIEENLVSPTFVIMKRYELDNQAFKNLIHIDAYRLKNADELIKIGWQEIYSNKDNLIIIEWPEMVEGLIPSNAIKVKLSHINENTRHIICES